MLRGSIRGVVGYVRWAYYDAARIDGYTVTRVGPAWTLTGRVMAPDAFKLAQRPLFFVAPHAKGEWRWPIEQLELMEPSQLRAILGAPLGDEHIWTPNSLPGKLIGSP